MVIDFDGYWLMNGKWALVNLQLNAAMALSNFLVVEPGSVLNSAAGFPPQKQGFAIGCRSFHKVELIGRTLGLQNQQHDARFPIVLAFRAETWEAVALCFDNYSSRVLRCFHKKGL